MQFAWRSWLDWFFEWEEWSVTCTQPSLQLKHQVCTTESWFDVCHSDSRDSSFSRFYSRFEQLAPGLVCFRFLAWKENLAMTGKTLVQGQPKCPTPAPHPRLNRNCMLAKQDPPTGQAARIHPFWHKMCLHYQQWDFFHGCLLTQYCVLIDFSMLHVE